MTNSRRWSPTPPSCRQGRNSVTNITLLSIFSKFFMGTIINNHPEYPLHFLQGKRSHDKNFNFLIFLGIWGSAFSILIHRGKDLNYFQAHFNSRICV